MKQPIALLLATVFWATAYEWDAVTPTSAPLRDIYFFNESDGIGVTTDEVLSTSDGGENWELAQKIEIGNKFGSLKEIMFVDSLNGFIRGGSRLFRTTDGGLSWEETSVSLYNSFAMDFVNKDSGMVVSNGSIKVTHNGGESYKTHSYGGSLFFRDCQVVTPTLWYAGGSVDLFRSADAGLTWERIALDLGESNKYLNGIHFRNELEGFIYFSGDVAHKTTDGGASWSPVAVPTSMTNIQRVGIDTLFANSGNNVMMWSFNGGVDWVSRTYDEVPQIMVYHVVNASTVFAINTFVRGFYKFTILSSQVDRIDDQTGGFLSSLSFGSNEIGVACGTVGNIKRTTDGGDSWIPQITAFEVIFGIQFISDNTVYAWGRDKNENGLIQKSDDAGVSWTTISDEDTYYIEFIDALHMYAATHNKIVRTADGGHTWTRVPLPPEMNSIRRIDIKPNGELLCSHDYGSLSILRNQTEWETLLQHGFSNKGEYFVSL